MIRFVTRPSSCVSLVNAAQLISVSLIKKLDESGKANSFGRDVARALLRAALSQTDESLNKPKNHQRGLARAPATINRLPNGRRGSQQTRLGDNFSSP